MCPQGRSRGLHLWKRYCSKSVLLKKWEVFEVRKRCPNLFPHFPLSAKIRFTPFDSLPLATMHFRNYQTLQKAQLQNFSQTKKRDHHRGVASLARSEGGAKLKTSVELDPNFHYFWIGFRRIFRKIRWSPKKKRKKVFAEIRRLFGRNQIRCSLLSKNTVGGQEINRGGKNKNRGGNAPLPPAGDAPGSPIDSSK